MAKNLEDADVYEEIGNDAEARREIIVNAKDVQEVQQAIETVKAVGGTAEDVLQVEERKDVKDVRKALNVVGNQGKCRRYLKIANQKLKKLRYLIKLLIPFKNRVEVLKMS